MMTQGDSIYDIIDSQHHSSVRDRLQKGSEEPVGEAVDFLCRLRVRNQRRQFTSNDQKVISFFKFTEREGGDHMQNQSRYVVKLQGNFRTGPLWKKLLCRK